MLARIIRATWAERESSGGGENEGRRGQTVTGVKNLTGKEGKCASPMSGNVGNEKKKR